MFFYFSYQLSTLRLLSFGSDETSYSIAAYPIDTPSARTVLIEGTFSGDEFDLYGLDRLIRDNLSEPGIHLLEIVGALFQGRESILFLSPPPYRVPPV